MCFKPRHAKYQRSGARETFSKLGLNEGGRKMCVFQRKTGHISETVRDMAIEGYYQSVRPKTVFFRLPPVPRKKLRP